MSATVADRLLVLSTYREWKRWLAREHKHVSDVHRKAAIPLAVTAAMVITVLVGLGILFMRTKRAK